MPLPHLQPYAKDPHYFLTTATHDRRTILTESSVLLILRQLWEQSVPHDGWFVGRYVIMPDHVHLFARPARDAKPLSSWMKLWKSVSARKISADLKLNPPIWQRDYFDHFLRSADSYSEKWDYVRNNPVRKGLVSSPELWPWQGVVHELTF